MTYIENIIYSILNYNISSWIIKGWVTLPSLHVKDRENEGH